MRKLILGSATVLPFLAAGASGAIVYDNTGGLSGSNSANLFTPATASIYFDDATTTGAAPFKISQVDLGYSNPTSSTVPFDVLIQFYNVVNYGALSGQPVGTSPIGSLIDIPGQSLPADSIGETGLYTLPSGDPISTTGAVGFEFEFVTPGTTSFSEANLASGIYPIFRNGTPLVGSSSDDFAYDYLNTSTIVGDAATGDVFNYSGPSANVYAEIAATVVPEPASVSLLAAGCVVLLSRRKRLNRQAAAVL